MYPDDADKVAIPVTPRLIFTSPIAEVLQNPVENSHYLSDDIDSSDEPSQGYDRNVEGFDGMANLKFGQPKVDALDELSVDELRKQQEEIDRKIKAKQEAEKQAIIDQIVEVTKTYGIPVEELVAALGGMKIKRKGVKAKPKYKDPATGAIWTGRGKEPAWIKGKDRTPFLIK